MCLPFWSVPANLRLTYVPSIPRHGGIHRLGPGIDAAGQVLHLAKPRLAQKLNGLAAARSGAAVGHDFVRGVELSERVRERAERDQGGALEPRDLPLLRLAHVQQEDLLPTIEPFLQFPGRDLELARDPGGVHLQTAEGLVVDELPDAGARATDGALGILPQLERAEGHRQGIEQEEPPDERRALAQDQLDDLGVLDQANDPGQHSEDASFGAGRDEPRGRRLGVETPIARAVLRREDRRLSLESENASVDVRL